MSKHHKQMRLNVPASEKLPRVSKMLADKSVAKILKLRKRRLEA
jgi:hypothetical protein